MKPKVELLCPNCGYVKFKKKSKFQLVKGLFLSIFVIWLTITSLFGSLAVYNFMQGHAFHNPHLVFNIGGAYATLVNTIKNFKSFPELDEESKKITSNCSDEYCKAKSVYDFLQTFHFAEGIEPLNTEKIYWEKEGDCDELSVLFCELVAPYKIHCVLQCEDYPQEDSGHCWAITKLNGKYYFVDVVQSIWKEV